METMDAAVGRLRRALGQVRLIAGLLSLAAGLREAERATLDRTIQDLVAGIEDDLTALERIYRRGGGAPRKESRP